MRRLVARYLWQGGVLAEGVALTHDGARVLGLEPAAEATPQLHVISPACTDLQVNGGGGVLLNNDPTAEGMQRIAAAHRERGTGWILPTVITDAPSVLEAAVAAAIACKGVPGHLGLHIEGPHLNPARRGTHKASFIRPLDGQTMALLKRLREADVPVLLTLAPETVEVADLRRIAEMGVVLSAGHTAATAAETHTALANGVTCFTHLFNAMPPMTSRAPGVVGAAINSQAFAGIIADGHHVSWEMLALAIRARPVPRTTFIVSDAMATVGGGETFELYGQKIRVEDGRLVNAEGALAGAHTDMVTGVRNLLQHVGLDLAEALAMATDVPRRAMGLAPQAIGPGTPLTDLIGWDEDLRLIPLS